jgi:hypothetical protein
MGITGQRRIRTKSAEPEYIKLFPHGMEEVVVMTPFITRYPLAADKSRTGTGGRVGLTFANEDLADEYIESVKGLPVCARRLP